MPNVTENYLNPNTQEGGGGSQAEEAVTKETIYSFLICLIGLFKLYLSYIRLIFQWVSLFVNFTEWSVSGDSLKRSIFLSFVFQDPKRRLIGYLPDHFWFSWLLLICCELLWGSSWWPEHSHPSTTSNPTPPALHLHLGTPLNFSNECSSFLDLNSKREVHLTNLDPILLSAGWGFINFQLKWK